MGSWYNVSINPEEMNCSFLPLVDPDFTNGAHDRNLLYTVEKLKYETSHNKHHNVKQYLAKAYEYFQLSSYPDKGIIAMRVGDSRSDDPIPVVSKTSLAGLLESESNSDYFSIIWALEMHRHYKAFYKLGWLERERIGITKWKDKKPTLIWRGALTGNGRRANAINKYCDANINDIDVSYSNKVSTEAVTGCKRRKSYTTMRGQLKFKYMLNIEGNDVSTGLKWQLASNSVVFMSKPTTVSFAMEDILVPFVHYVPVNDDYSNLMEMVEWARENDEKCKWISRQATLYMKRLWMTKEAQNDYHEIQKQLANKYIEQFGDALQTCRK